MGKQADFKHWQRVSGEGSLEEEGPRDEMCSRRKSYYGCVMSQKVVKQFNPKSSQHKENFFSFIFLLYLHEMMDAS